MGQTRRYPVSRLRRPRRAARAAAGLLTGLVLGVAAASPVAGAAWTGTGEQPATSTALPAERAEPTARLDMAVTAVTPAIATPGRPVSITLTVTNLDTQPAADVRVRAHLGRSALDTRTEVGRFAAGRGPAIPSDEVAAATLGVPLAPGASAPITVTIDGGHVDAPADQAIRPLTLEASAGAEAGMTDTKRTFLPIHSNARYRPLRVAYAIPLTMNPDPRLLTATGAELDHAWNAMAGPGRRIDDILRGTEEHDVTYALDPALVGWSPPTEATEPPPAGESAPIPSPQIARLTESIAQRVTRAGAGVWQVPPHDPDLAPLAAPDADRRLLGRVAVPASGLPAHLDAKNGAAPAPTDIPALAWPVGETLEADARVAVDAAMSGDGEEGRTVFVTETARVDADADVTGPAARKTSGGSPLLVTDSVLGGLLAGATGPDHAGEVTQRILAETMAHHAQAPSRPRTVLIAPPRAFDPEPAALDTVLDALDSAPWIDTVPATEILDAARDDSAPAAQPRRDNEDVPDSPLTPAAISSILDMTSHMAGLGSVLTPTDTSRFVPDPGTTRALTSARWRGHTAAHTSTRETIGTRIETLTTGVSVLPSTVNFLAEHGVLQVTVVNNLDVAVHGVRLVLDPEQRTPRLRIAQPDPMTIAPGSRTVVRVAVEAVAAGTVPVSTHLQTPAGTRLGSDAIVEVRVQPSGGWTIAIGGALVVLVFVVGLIRTIRRGRPRVTDDDLKGIDLE